MRRIAKVDRNQAAIVEALRAAGATVICLHQVGKGCPDILCGYKGENFLLEVKDGERNRHNLTLDEQIFIESWDGQVEVVVDEIEALMAIGAVAGCKVW